MSKSIVPIENRVVEARWVRKQNAVYDDYVKGEQNFTALAKRHNVTRAKAIEMVNQVNDYVRQSGVFKEMSKERLAEMDHHYGMLIKEAWNAVEELKNDGKWDKVPASLKIAGDLEAKRQEALQKAGMYDDFEVGDMLAEAEMKIDQVKGLLRKIIEAHPETKNLILNGLKDIEDPNRLPDPDIVDGEVV